MPRARRPFLDWPRAGLALLLATLLWLVVRAQLNDAPSRGDGPRATRTRDGAQRAAIGPGTAPPSPSDAPR